MPEPNMKTCCIESRLDLLDLASIALYYKTLGLGKTTKSALIASAIHDFAAALQANSLTREITSIEEALEILLTLIDGFDGAIRKTRQTVMRQLKINPVESSLQQQVEQQAEDELFSSPTSLEVTEIMRRMNQASVQPSPMLLNQEKGGEKKEDEQT